MQDILLPLAEREQIKACANGLLRKYLGYGDAFERLMKLAKDHRIDVMEADMSDLSGALKREQGSWRIYINRLDSPTRQLFTLAHELGHFFLHRQEDDSFVDGDLVMNRDDDGKYSKKELEANEFAGNVVMPEDIIKRKLKGREPQEEVVLELAEAFHVSPLAMVIRLRSVGYELSPT